MALVKSTDENYKELIASKGKLTLIKFTADWCGPCKAINPILESISEKMADKIVIANHDVDSQPTLQLLMLFVQFQLYFYTKMVHTLIHLLAELTSQILKHL